VARLLPGEERAQAGGVTRVAIRWIALLALLFFGSEEPLQAVDLPHDQLSPVLYARIPELVPLQTSNGFAQGIEGPLLPYIFPHVGIVPAEIGESCGVYSPYSINTVRVLPFDFGSPSGEKMDKRPLPVFLVSPERKAMADNHPEKTAGDAQQRDVGSTHNAREVPWYIALPVCMAALIIGVLLGDWLAATAEKRRKAYSFANVRDHGHLPVAGPMQQGGQSNEE
jgi:hypothetical protein